MGVLFCGRVFTSLTMERESPITNLFVSFSHFFNKLVSGESLFQVRSDSLFLIAATFNSFFLKKNRINIGWEVERALRNTSPTSPSAFSSRINDWWATHEEEDTFAHQSFIWT